MYEDLINRLRNESQNAIEACDFDFAIAWMQEAADAIEELQKAVNFHKFNSEFWEDKYNRLDYRRPGGHRLLCVDDDQVGEAGQGVHREIGGE